MNASRQRTLNLQIDAYMIGAGSPGDRVSVRGSGLLTGVFPGLVYVDRDVTRQMCHCASQ